ncbi:acyl-CoA carboxylase epsilon subunit, partial [Streptomonospora nanhaiensis]
AEGAPYSGWRDRARLLRRPPAPGPGAWRAAYGPG